MRKFMRNEDEDVKDLKGLFKKAFRFRTKLFFDKSFERW